MPAGHALKKQKDAENKMLKIRSISPEAAGNSWLLQFGKSAVIYDTGFACMADETTDNALKLQEGCRVENILISHSHYDHASGTAIFTKKFPEAKVNAGAYASYVFTRPGAIRTMREMNLNAAKMYGREPDDETIGEIRIDRELHDGDIIQTEEYTFEAWETPGHTKCSISYFCPEESLLLASETIGVPNSTVTLDGDFIVMPCCMVGVESGLKAIRRAIEADPQKILLSHTGLVTGGHARIFLRKSLEWLERARDLVLKGADEGKDLPQLIADWKKIFYTEEVAKNQPEAAFDLNTSYAVPAILKEYGK